MMTLHLGRQPDDSPTTAAMDARSSTGHTDTGQVPVPAQASASASASNGPALAGDGPDVADRPSTLGRAELVSGLLDVLLGGLLYPAASPRSAGRG